MAVEGRFSPFLPGGGDITVLLKYHTSGPRIGKKEIRVNDKPVKDRKELVSNIPCIIFSHEDIGFVNGPPERRRWFFNQTMSLYEPFFIDILRRYRKLLKSRNQALRERRRELLDIYDLQLAEAGLEIVRRRTETAKEFNESFESLFREISGIDDKLTVYYAPSWKGCERREQVQELLSKRHELDFEMSTTTTGPHRDRFIFTLQKRNFAKIASTGQLRLMSLILRVAQARYFSEKTGREPLLLLDDVLLELDTIRRDRFLSCLPPAEQRFFTFLPDEQFRPFVGPDTLMYKVEKGGIITQ
jgi:DNA replication and repair protein RecF